MSFAITNGDCNCAENFDGKIILKIDDVTIIKTFAAVSFTLKPSSLVSSIRSSEWDIRRAFSQILKENCVYEKINIEKNIITVKLLYANGDAESLFREKLTGRILPIGSDRFHIYFHDAHALALGIGDDLYPKWLESQSIWLRNVPTRLLDLNTKLDDTHKLWDALVQKYGPIVAMDTINSNMKDITDTPIDMNLNKDICIKFQNMESCHQIMNDFGFKNSIIIKLHWKSDIIYSETDQLHFLSEENLKKRKRRKEKYTKLLNKISNEYAKLTDQCNNIMNEIQQNTSILLSDMATDFDILSMNDALKTRITSILSQAQTMLSKLPAEDQMVSSSKQSILFLEESLSNIRTSTHELKEEYANYKLQINEYIEIFKSKQIKIQEELRIQNFEVLKQKYFDTAQNTLNLCEECKLEYDKLPSEYQNFIPLQIMNKVEILSKTIINMITRCKKNTSMQLDQALTTAYLNLEKILPLKSNQINILKFCMINYYNIIKLEEDIQIFNSIFTSTSTSSSLLSLSISTSSILGILCDSKDSMIIIKQRINHILQTLSNHCIVENNEMNIFNNEWMVVDESEKLYISKCLSIYKSTLKSIQSIHLSLSECYRINKIILTGNNLDILVEVKDKFEFQCNRLLSLLRSGLNVLSNYLKSFQSNANNDDNNSPMHWDEENEDRIDQLLVAFAHLNDKIINALERFECECMSKADVESWQFRHKEQQEEERRRLIERTCEAAECSLMRKEEQRVVLLRKIYDMMLEKERLLKAEEEERMLILRTDRDNNRNNQNSKYSHKQKNRGKRKRSIEDDHAQEREDPPEREDIDRWDVGESDFDAEYHTVDGSVVGKVQRPMWDTMSEPGEVLSSSKKSNNVKSIAVILSEPCDTAREILTMGRVVSNNEESRLIKSPTTNIDIIDSVDTKKNILTLSKNEKAELQIKERLLANIMQKRRLLFMSK